jgi:tetratricopeptide (TPR) repeat protein
VRNRIASAGVLIAVSVLCVVAALEAQRGGEARVPLNDTAASTLLPVRPELVAVPLPSLDALEPPVVQQMDQQLRTFRDGAANLDRGALAEAYGRLGQVYHAYQLFDGAEASYENARRLAPRDYRWPHLLGYLQQQTGRFERALELYGEAIRLEAGDHVAGVHLGEVYLQIDRRGDARRQFEAARARYPLSAMAGLGEIALRERRYEDAIRLLEDVLRRAPYATELHYSVGMAYRGLGRVEQALVHLTQAGQGRVRAADPLVDALPGLVRGARAALNQARIEFQAGAYQAAAAAFRRAIDADSASLEARTGLAGALERLGDLDGALNELRESAARLAESAEAQRQYAGALLVRGRATEAVGVLEKAVALDGGDEDSLLQLVILLADRQRFADALALLDGAAQRFPDRDRTATTLARMLAASPDASIRNGARSLDLARRVYARTPSAVHGETIALSLAELGRCAEAAEWMRKAIAQAIEDGDTGESARLRSETPKYGASACRP